jgi:hypothetical protein
MAINIEQSSAHVRKDSFLNSPKAVNPKLFKENLYKSDLINLPQI